MLDRFAALDLSPNWYSVLSADLTLVWVNKALAEGFGHVRSDLISKGLFEAFPRARGVLEVEGDEAVRRSVDAVFRTGQPDRIALHFHAGSMEEAVDEGAVFTISHSPIFDETGAVHLVLAHLSNATEFARLLAPSAPPPARLGDVPQVASQILSGALDLADTNRALYEDRDRLRQMFDQAPGFIALLTGVDHVFELVNGAYHRLVGDRPLIGLPAREAVPEIYQVFGPALERAYATGEAFVGHGLTMTVDNGVSEPTEKAVDFVFQPLTDAAGQVFGVFLEGADVTERTRAEQTQRLLMRELQHRIKNTLATVRAIAARSARTTPDPQLFIRAFEDRLIALAASHELLTQGGWKGADVHDLIERELRPYDVSRLRLAGERRQVPPQAAVPLSLAIHELATNAAKYGALSADSGRVDVEWWTEEKMDQPRLRVQWRESGGPPVAGPSRRGFGTELLDGMMRRGADPVLDFARTGLRCTFELPLGRSAPSLMQGAPRPMPSSLLPPDLKVLIVEDEMFVSWGLEAALVEQGHVVCGIAQSAEEALQLAEAHRPDLIFMDIGLFGPGDGLEVARRILAERPTRIAFSSAWNDPRTLAAIEELGAYANIPKPCREADLVAVADRAWQDVCAQPVP